MYKFDNSIRKTLLDISLSRYSKEDVVLPFEAGKNVRYKYAVHFYENKYPLRSALNTQRQISQALNLASG